MRSTLRQSRVAGTIGAAGLGIAVLAGCGNDTAGPETGTSVGEIQEDQVPAEAAESPTMSFAGMTVTVSADVSEIVSERAFTIAGTENTGTQPLLVVSSTGAPQVNEDSAVAVTGTVRKAFDLPAVESELGIDLDDGLYDAYDRQPYIVATQIDPTVAEPSESTGG